MSQKTSVNVKPCNVGSSKEHNRRTKQYLANVNKDNIYVRTDLMANNESWISQEIGEQSLRDYQKQLAQIVKEKTGRAMQTKEHLRVNKKTGKVTTISGCSPIREGVVVCKKDTTIDQLKHFCDLCTEQWGIKPLHIFIHRDEGHYENPKDPDSWKPNYHAHIVWDWINHDTGKSCKLNHEAMRVMQTLLADSLGMERGISKEITNKQHLDRNDYVLARQKEENERLTAEHSAIVSATENAKEKQIAIQSENEELLAQSANLTDEIADKRKELKRIEKESKHGLWAKAGSLVGVGEIAQLKEQVKSLEYSLAKEKERLKQHYQQQAKSVIEQRTAEYQTAKAEWQTERNSLIEQNNTLSRTNRKLAADKEQLTEHYEYRLKWRNEVLHMLAHRLYQASELIRKAIDTIIAFAKDKWQTVFGGEQATTIKTAINEFTDNKSEQLAVGNWLVNYATVKGNLSDPEIDKANNEVDDIVNGRYDAKIEKAEVRSR